SWEVNTTYPPVGHISVGATNAYFVSTGGYGVAINPADSVTGSRVVFSCPTMNPIIGMPPLRTFVAGGALGSTPLSGSDSTPQETLFAYTQDGHLQLFRQQNFPGSINQLPD